MTPQQKKRIALVTYLIDNGIQVIPLARGKKFPTVSGWQNIYMEHDEVTTYVLSGYGFGIKPNDDFAYIDIDGDHVDGVSGLDNWFSIVNNFTMPTVWALKEGSNNMHLFYANTTHDDSRFTSTEALADGVEYSARDSQVRICPAYEFQNLDLTRPFMEQLAPVPDEVLELIAAYNTAKKNRPYVPEKRQANNIKAYLKACDPFPQGERSLGYRRLVYTMVIKHGMPYDDVCEAVTEWDFKNGDFQHDEPKEWYHATRNPE